MDALHYTPSDLWKFKLHVFKRGIKWKGMQYVTLRFSSHDKQLRKKKKLNLL